MYCHDRDLHDKFLIQAALHLIEERGYASFSMGELAKYLHVRPASLYNHIENLDTLYTEVGLAAISQMVGAEKEAIEGKSGMRLFERWQTRIILSLRHTTSSIWSS